LFLFSERITRLQQVKKNWKVNPMRILVNRAIKIWQKIKTEMKITIMPRTAAGYPQNNVITKTTVLK
jgi:hypothetical protein